MYADNDNGRVPLMYSKNWSGNGRQILHTVTGIIPTVTIPNTIPYLNSTQAILCPAMGKWTREYYYRCYGVAYEARFNYIAVNSGNIALNSTDSASGNEYIIHRLDSPSQYVTVFDCFNSSSKEAYYIAVGVSQIYMLHTNRANILFADGHVGSISGSDLQKNYTPHSYVASDTSLIGG
jgi:prepilin-type processing-associated H-X9-DG protein